ncbi:MAG: hypothetical protein AAFU64_19165 [Bacteroidota bacterium]
MSSKIRVTTYSPEPALKNPGRLLRELWQDLSNSRELAWRLMVRNIRAKYRQSFLGIFWAFIPPLVTTATWIFLNASQIFQIGDTGDIPYPLFVISGTILWTSFVNALNKPVNIMSTSRSMLTKLVQRMVPEITNRG